MDDKRCAVCSAPYEEKGELYFNRTSILARSNEIPQVVITCHKCLQFYYAVVIPDLIKTYRGDDRVCLMVAKSSTVKKSGWISSLLKHLQKSRG